VNNNNNVTVRVKTVLSRDAGIRHVVHAVHAWRSDERRDRVNPS